MDRVTLLGENLLLIRRSCRKHRLKVGRTCVNVHESAKKDYKQGRRSYPQMAEETGNFEARREKLKELERLLQQGEVPMLRAI